MIDWSAIATPGAPPRRELGPALAYGGAFAVALVLVPAHALSPARNAMAIAVVALVLLTLALRVRGWPGVVAASVVIVGGFEVSLKAEPLLPAALRTVSLYQISDVASGLALGAKRIVLLGPAALIAAIVCLSRPAARLRFREAMSPGTWSGGIRWPLPWWGVPVMPLWLFFGISLPLLIVGFLPLVDWGATTARWETLSLGVWTLIPLLAVLNATLEEIIFRAGLLSVCAERLSAEAATIPVALVFGFAHFSGGVPDGLLGAALLSGGSFFLGYFVLIQRGLSGAIVWHATADVIVLAFVIG